MANASSPRAEILRSKDFIGWAVTSSNGANVGTVSDILIDLKGQVRFLAVDPGFFKKPYLLPVEALEWGDGSMQTAWTDLEVKRLPPYDPGVALTAPVVEELGRAFPRHYGAQRGQAWEPGTGPSIVPLKDAKDFRLAKCAPNLKGWAVYGSDNEKVGAVAQMLVDPIAMKIRYLDVDVADDLFGLSDDRHVLVPLEAVELRERSQDAWVQGVTARDLAALPAYLGGPVDPLLEQEVGQAFSGVPAAPAAALEEGASSAPRLAPPPADTAADAEESEDEPPRDEPAPPPIRDAEFAAPETPPALPPEWHEPESGERRDES